MNQNAREVLIANSKAQLEGAEDGLYAAVRADGVLCWYDKNGNERCPVALHVAFRQDWVPCPEDKEIRPEKAGELWESQTGSKYFTVYQDEQRDILKARCEYDESWESNGGTMSGMIHNKNGWTRLLPHVEDDKERQKREIEKAAIASIDKPFVMEEMSARAAGICGDGCVDMDKHKEWLKKRNAKRMLDAIKPVIADKSPLTGAVFAYAESLARSIWEKHYKEVSPDWEPLDTVYGMLSQIDNMVTGLQKPVEDGYARKVEIDRVLWYNDNHRAIPTGPYTEWEGLADMPPMKMILLFPKEQHECQG